MANTAKILLTTESVANDALVDDNPVPPSSNWIGVTDAAICKSRDSLKARPSSVLERRFKSSPRTQGCSDFVFVDQFDV